MSESQSVSERRSEILDRIAAAAKRAGRNASDIALVAVSKQQSDDRVRAGLDAGQMIFGENRVQEAAARWHERFRDYRDHIELRLIGPLQTNKADEAVAIFDVIETLDREKLLKALLKAADKAGRMPELFVQVNTGEEPQKSGLLPHELGVFLDNIFSEYAIRPTGLMCIPPVGEAASPHFWLLNNLARDHGLEKLSMGMSADFETAIEMGATYIRVGSALFGARG